MIIYLLLGNLNLSKGLSQKFFINLSLAWQFKFNSSMQRTQVYRSVGWGVKDEGPPDRIGGSEAPRLVLLLRTCAKRKGLTGRLAAHGESALLMASAPVCSGSQHRPLSTVALDRRWRQDICRDRR